jgi:beta-barrel assembly-enhancing protease
MTAILRTCLSFALCACVVGGPAAEGRQTGGASPGAGSATPSFNLFTVEQDIEIGKQSAAEAEKQLPMLRDAATDRYVERIVLALAAQAPGAKFPYHAKAVNDATINAFALPGGPTYVNRGLIEAARNEDELAGVMAHEIAHVALRHGTHQASKAYLAQAGLGILGGLLGQDSATTAQVVNVVGGLGLNALFLKYSRDAESEADATGAQIMARAGYDPNAMADFFALLREKGDQGKVATFFSDHPAPADREAKIRQLAATLPHPAKKIGGLKTIQAELTAMAPAPSSQLAQAQRSPQTTQRSQGSAAVTVPAPSSQFKTFNHPTGFFSIDYPANWEAHAGSGYGASVFPPGGAVASGDGEQTLVYGVVVNHYEPFEAGQRRGSLAEANDDLVRTILHANPYLKVVDGSETRAQISDAPATSVVLSGRSPVTNTTERVTVVTRSLRDGHIVYALLIAPERDQQALAPAFTRMVNSLEIHDVASHP